MSIQTLRTRCGRGFRHARALLGIRVLGIDRRRLGRQALGRDRLAVRLTEAFERRELSRHHQARVRAGDDLV